MGELFENLGINWKLLIAQAVNFLLVFWLLKRFVFPKMFAFMEKRRQRIEQGLEFANKSERELERIRDARHRELENARKAGEVLLAENKTKADRKIKETLTLAKQEAEKLILAAKMQGAREQQDMLKAAKDDMAKTSLLVAQKIVSRVLKPQDEERLLKEAMEEVENVYGK